MSRITLPTTRPLLRPRRWGKLTMSIVGGEVGINLIHHTGNDSLRWHVRVDVEMNGPLPP